MGRLIIWHDEWYPVVGGLELALHRTAEAINAAGIEVTVVTLQDGRNREHFPYAVTYAERERWVQKSGKLIQRLAKSGDVIYVARLFCGVERAQLEFMRGICCHRILRLPSTWSKERYAKLNGKIDSAFDEFIALNERSLLELQKRFPYKKNHLCYNWSPSCNVSDYLSRSGFAYCGRLARSKNISNLIAGWSCYRETHADDLVLVTDSTYIPDCFSDITARRKGYRPKLVDPYVPGTLGILSKFRFLILPSFREGCPNILVEAYGHGVPVIGSAIPGIEEHLRAVNAPLIEKPFNSDSIQKAMKTATALSWQEYIALCKRIRRYHATWFGTETVAPIIARQFARSDHTHSQDEGSSGFSAHSYMRNRQTATTPQSLANL